MVLRLSDGCDAICEINRLRKVAELEDALKTLHTFNVLDRPVDNLGLSSSDLLLGERRLTTPARNALHVFHMRSFQHLPQFGQLLGP